MKNTKSLSTSLKSRLFTIISFLIIIIFVFELFGLLNSVDNNYYTSAEKIIEEYNNALISVGNDRLSEEDFKEYLIDLAEKMDGSNGYFISLYDNELNPIFNNHLVNTEDKKLFDIEKDKTVLNSMDDKKGNIKLNKYGYDCVIHYQWINDGSILMISYITEDNFISIYKNEIVIVLIGLIILMAFIETFQYHNLYKEFSNKILRTKEEDLLP